MELTYTERNGVMYPDLALPEQTNYPIGKYGKMRLDYLKKHRRGTYTTLCEANAGSHLPLEDRGACTPGEGCANLRLGRIPCHLDQKALGNTRFPRLFALPLTQLLGGCYAICYANTRNT
ncbi:MAG: TnpV protein [Clostridia bacterium]|nr:TnpV protein [Clostridia bacterium]